MNIKILWSMTFITTAYGAVVSSKKLPLPDPEDVEFRTTREENVTDHLRRIANVDRWTIKGYPCKFPFSFNRVIYTDCAPGTYQPKPWCAETVEEDIYHTVKTWGICASPTMSPSVLASCSCGMANTRNRIIDGTEVGPGQKYPWLVGLRAYYPNNDLSIINCGGSIINTEYVLTAAHCFYDSQNCIYNPPEFLHVHVGVYDQFNLNVNDGINKLIPVEDIIMHPSYDCETDDDDFALLKLFEPIVYNEVIRPVCLPKDDSRTYAGETATIAGWGRTDLSDEIGSKKLHEVDISILDNNNCGDYEAWQITSTMMCAGDLVNGGKGTCYGDSGGPLVVKDTASKYVQVGIASWAEECALKDFPSVFARVSKVLDWIKENSASGQYCAN